MSGAVPLIYLDWNIFKYLKNQYKQEKILSDPFFKKLLPLLKYFYTPYSNVHLIDLNKGYNDEPEIYEKIKDDLKFVSVFSNNWCLTKYWGKTFPTLSKRDPIDFFNQIHEDSKNESSVNDLNNIFSEINNIPEFSEQAEKINEILKTEIVIPKSIIGTLPFFNKEEPEKNSYKVEDLLKTTANWIDLLNEDHFKYKELRNNVNIFSDFSKENDPNKATLEIIDEWLKKSIFKKTFKELVDDDIFKLRVGNKDEDENYYKISTAYIFLDMLGIGKDRINHNNTFENLQNDALHVYYGSLSLIFITEDKAMKLKSSLIYKYFDIKTPVLNIKDFVEKVELKVGADEKDK